ncbi:MAG TPA: hypothetical protein PLP39_03735 [Flavobacterium lutivivi]|nr:hypothetical protein [Flavobacterium lutivivi]
MKKVLWFVLFFALKSNLIFSQCAYTGTPLTQAGSTYTFCIDNSNTITTATVRSGQYVVVNVVKGFNYTFSIGNVFNGGRAENLTILNASTNANVSPAAFSSGTSGTSLTWTASLTGQIKILLSRGSCANDNATGGTMTLTLNSVGNTQDSQTTFGTNQWVGHVYNWTGTAPPGGTSPSTPSATNPFTSANYVGYYNVNSETISENFGGDYNCFQVYSNGANATNIYTEQYAVRYRMRSTKVGCYLATFNGDDGIRVYVDGVKVFDEWKEQPPTGYGNVLLYLNGNSDIIFDFYENGGQNTANFSLAPFTSNPNTISQTTVNVCSGVLPGALDGNAYTYNGGTANPSITFQWQSSTDNVTFTNISGATSEDYTPPTQTTTTTNIIRYYRRIVTASAGNAGGCTYNSNVVTVTTSPGTPSTPGTISGTVTQCPSLTGQIYSIAAVNNANNYTWSVPTGWSITSGNGTTSITVTTGTTGQNGNITVNASNGCGTSANRTLAVTVSTLAVAGTASANQTICSGTTPANLTLTGSTGTIQWQSSTDNVTFTNISGATSATLAGTTIGTLTATRYYRAFITGGCSTATSNVVTITVNPTSVAGTASSNQTICSGSTPANLTLTGSTGTFQWQSSTDNVTFTNISGANSATLAGTTIGALTATRYFRAIVTSGVCSAATSNVVTITIGGNSTWNGSNWDITPSGTTNLIFNGDYTSSGDINGCICTVNTGNVVINSGHDMSLIGSVSVNGGSLTFENNSNLIQQQNVSNSGNITVKRNSTPLRRLDYILWSSPVVGQNLLSFSPATLTNRFYTYNTNTNLYDVIGSPASTNFATGKGYLIRVPNNFPSITPTIYNGVFTGVPNNGNISFAIVDGGSDTVRFNATGNPYPSAINLDNFITSNSSNIEGTLWFWRKLNDDTNPVSYSTCTTVGCTINNSHTYTDENLISVGQGFLVKAKAGATVVNYTNAIRSSENINQFFRTTSIDRYWLELKNGSDKSFGKKLIAYVDDASLGYDDGKDGLYLNDSPIALTSITDNRELIIQARPTFDAGDIIPLNFKTTVADTYSISLTEKEGLFNTQAIYLIDSQLSVVHNLQQSPYSFTSEVGNFTDRFEIVYDGALSNNDNQFENNIAVYSNNSNLTVKSTKDLIDSITIYDLSGRLLLNEKGLNTLEQHLKLKQSNQVLIIKVKTIEGTFKIQKVIF